MELRDIIVTPFVFFIVIVLAYIIRPMVSDAVTYRYYFPALLLKMFGAIALGIVYQFYYSGGDTYAFQNHGSRHIWEAFMDSPDIGIKLLFAKGESGPGMWEYARKIWYFNDQHSYFIIRIAAVLDLFTFSSYSATAILFAVISFTGGWMMFLTFYKRYPLMHRWLALACLFVPSVIFWGSGILKDTITLAFAGMATYCVHYLFIERRFHFGYGALLLFSFFVIYSVKIYILMSLLAAFVVWSFFYYYFKINSGALRLLAVPFVVLISLVLSYYGIQKISEDDPRYALDKIAITAQVTAYDIRYYTGKDAGSGYSLGELDGSMGSLVRLAPGAINVSLFRPYLWEVRNPLMLLSAVESLFTLLITLYVLYKVRSRILLYIQTPEVVFCLIFSLMFAFAVGVSTYNFGSLARYKIPVYPFYFVALAIIMYQHRLRQAELDPANPS